MLKMAGVFCTAKKAIRNFESQQFSIFLYFFEIYSGLYSFLLRKSRQMDGLYSYTFSISFGEKFNMLFFAIVAGTFFSLKKRVVDGGESKIDYKSW